MLRAERCLEEVARSIETSLQELGEPEVPSGVIGEKMMSALHDIDQVAYVRFASVYREFKDLNAFMDQLKELIGARQQDG